jgi:hypothetical protein
MTAAVESRGLCEGGAESGVEDVGALGRQLWHLTNEGVDPWPGTFQAIKTGSVEVRANLPHPLPAPCDVEPCAGLCAS